MSRLKDEASLNMAYIHLTLLIAQPPMSSFDEAREHPLHVRDARGIPSTDVLVKGRSAGEHGVHRYVTPEVSHAPMSSLKDDATEL